MQLTNLKPLYRQMMQNDLSYCVFAFSVNNVEFDIFYDVGVTPNKIGFLPIGDNRQLWLNVRRGFFIDDGLSKDQYYTLVNILGLERAPDNKFKPANFFNDFNNRIPETYRQLNERERATIVGRAYTVEEHLKTEYDGLYDWDKLGIKKIVLKKTLRKQDSFYLTYIFKSRIEILVCDIKFQRINLQHEKTPHILFPIFTRTLV